MNIPADVLSAIAHALAPGAMGCRARTGRLASMAHSNVTGCRAMVLPVPGVDRAARVAPERMGVPEEI